MFQCDHCDDTFPTVEDAEEHESCCPRAPPVHHAPVEQKVRPAALVRADSGGGWEEVGKKPKTNRTQTNKPLIVHHRPTHPEHTVLSYSVGEYRRFPFSRNGICSCSGASVVIAVQVSCCTGLKGVRLIFVRQNYASAATVLVRVIANMRTVYRSSYIILATSGRVNAKDRIVSYIWRVSVPTGTMETHRLSWVPSSMV